MAADSMLKASTHERVGHTGQGLWKHKGWQLPAYFQHVANDLIDEGRPESEAVHLAVGIVENWKDGHDGKGHQVSATTQAAAAKAWAEWEKLKSQTKGGKLSEATAAAPALSNAPRRPGESLSSWGTRLKAGDAALAAQQAASKKTRSGKSSSTSSTRSGGARSSQPRTRDGKFTFGQGSGDTAAVQGVQSHVGAKVDGKFGGQTKQAVMRYQQQHGLKVDGVVGRQTVASMQGRAGAAKVAVGAMSAADRAWLVGARKRGPVLEHNSNRKAGRMAESALAMELTDEQIGDLSLLEAAKMDAEDKKDGGSDEATEDMPSVYCVKCAKKVTPKASGKCPGCGTDLSKAVAAAKKAAA